MTKTLLSLLFLLLSAAGLAAKPKPTPPPKPAAAVDSAALYRAYADSINNSLHYQQGHISLPGGIGELTVPKGYHYLDSTQSGYVLHKLWHNPPQANLGMLFPLNRGPLSENNWGYIVQYEPLGYVKDNDADDINYDELLETMQKESEEENPAREEAGYEAVHVYGWGAKPYYDKQQHTLHWAKLLRFGSGLEQTLNYNVRILGRKGVLIFNAVADPAQLPEIKASIPGLLANVQFVRGEQYRDFNPEVDEVAAYSIGGLVAGKVLAKVGAFALIAKFWKVVILALGGAWAGIKRFFGFGKEEE
ncbi:MAG: DUF2167 domain-containing protein [Janthinobacterium lividum]